ncbi:MAG: S8 family serine peptidase [Wenzhouxiangella sp.]|nr:S8 family serine peptidase [Wenzhouxiangella sp.]
MGAVALTFAQGPALSTPNDKGLSPLDGLLGKNPELQVDPEVLAMIEAGETPDLLVSFVTPDLSDAYKMSWNERGRYVYKELERARMNAQSPLQDYFDLLGVEYESYRVGNLMVVRQADLDSLQTLMSYRATRVISEKPEFFLIEPEETTEFMPANSAEAEPNLGQIGATDVWDQLGVTGEGIVVGLNDSPPRYTHSVLQSSYRGFVNGEFEHDYNWYDPAGNQSAPVGENHGTHVLGTMVGNDGGTNVTGVAIGAQWMACGGCVGQGCPSVLACLDFFVAPTDRQGANPNPDLRPHVVNNSWGDCGQSYNAIYESIWDSMYAAGVIPMISNGNASNCGYSSPPGPNTVGNPARAGRVMGIGSTTQTGGNYATHSNWGPTDSPNPGLDGGSFDHFGFPDIKPNVVAPGQGIRSSVASSDTAFAGFTGTSMASPHASGVAALMMSAAPCLIGNHVRINTILMDTANPVAYDGGPFGDDVNPEAGVNLPNYATGWGEIDAFAAVQAAAAECGPSGTLTGAVTDADTGQSLRNVSVSIPNPAQEGPTNFDTVTNVDGQYNRILPEGTYDITFSRFGYIAQTETIEVVADQEVSLDVALAPAEVVTLTGSVTDSATGWGLHALIDIAGAPDTPYFTDPVTGAFAINLPEAFTADMTVISAVPGYQNRTLEVVVEDGANVPVTLDADLAVCAAPGYEVTGAEFMEDFQTDGGFTSSGTGDSWAWGTPTVWPNACTAGSNCWGTNLDGNYGNSADMTLTSPVIDLSGASGDLLLTWDQANHIENSLFDNASAQISVNGGEWQTVWAHSGATSQVDWRELSADVSAAAGGTLQLRWNLSSDSSVDFPGVYIDNIQIRSSEACAAPASGSLLFGHVFDVNTGDPVADAQVIVTGLGQQIMTTSPDPTYPAGVFYTFMPGEFDAIDRVFADRFEVETGVMGEPDFELSVRASSPFYTDDEVLVGPTGQTVGAFLGLTAGRLNVQPASLTETVTLGAPAGSSIALLNTGSQPLSFDASNIVIDSVSNVYEQDFEDTFPPQDWSVQNLGGDCTWARNDDVGLANFAGGDGFAATADSDACGSGTTMDTELVSPTFDLSAIELPGYSFVLSYRHLGTSRLDFDISTDDGQSWSTLESWGASESAQGPGTLVSGSLSDFAAETTVRFRFRYVSPGWNWWAQVDQFRITGAQAFVSASPETGTIAPGSAALLDIAFDGSLVDLPGTYQAALLIGHDTPYSDGLTAVPLTMEVEPNEGLSRIEGRIRGLGYCDAAPINAAGAEVVISGQTQVYELVADDNGQFGVWLPTSESPLTISASAPNHVSDFAANVPLASQQTTVQDIDLRLDVACASVSPESSTHVLEAGATLPFQGVLKNDGAADWSWNEITGMVNTGVVYATPDNGTNGFSANAFPGQGNEVVVPADDFEADGRPLSRITIDGFALPGGQTLETVATGFTFAIYADDNGRPAGNPEQPGSELFLYSGALDDPAFTVVAPGQIGSISIDLMAAVGGLALPSGTYWVTGWATSVATTPTGPRWIWFNTDNPVSGSIAQIYTSADGDWDLLDSDLAFQIESGAICGSLGTVVSSPGVVGSDDVQIVDLAIDAGGVIPGVYSDAICFEGNDPFTPIVVHSMDIEVTAPATFGTLSGVVTSSGYCDAESIPVEGAEVIVDGDSGPFTVFTGPDGSYSLQVDQGAYNVTASAPDHLDQTEAAAVTTSTETTQDVVLRLDAPCASVSPAQLDVVGNDASTVGEVLTINNDGGAAMTWNFVGSAVPAGLVSASRERYSEPLLRGSLQETSGESGEGLNRAAGSAALVEYLFDDLDGLLGSITLSHSNSLAIGGGTVACGSTGLATTAENSYYRVFNLEDFGLIGGFELTEITFGIQDVNVNVDVEVIVHALDGALSTANLTEIGRVTESLTSQTGTLVTVPLTGEVAAGGTLVVEVNSPDLTDGRFILGSNDLGQTAPSYIRSAACGINAITDYVNVGPGFPDVHLVITASGNEILACDTLADVGWLSADVEAGSLTADGSIDVNLTFDGGAAGAGQFGADLCVQTSDAEQALIEIPVTFGVTN